MFRLRAWTNKSSLGSLPSPLLPACKNGLARPGVVTSRSCGAPWLGQAEAPQPSQAEPSLGANRPSFGSEACRAPRPQPSLATPLSEGGLLCKRCWRRAEPWCWAQANEPKH